VLLLLLLLQQGHAAKQFLLTIKCSRRQQEESSVQGHSASIPSIMQQISMRDHLPPGQPKSHQMPPKCRPKTTQMPPNPTHSEPNEMPGVWPRSRHVALVVGRVFVGYVADGWVVLPPPIFFLLVVHPPHPSVAGHAGRSSSAGTSNGYC